MGERPSRRAKLSRDGSKGPAPRSGGMRRGPGRSSESEGDEGGDEGGEEESEPPPPSDPTFKLQGASLAVKVAFACVISVAIASVALVIAAFTGAKTEVDEEINQAGIRMAKVVASVEVSVWKEFGQSPTARAVGNKMADAAIKLSQMMQTLNLSNPEDKKQIDAVLGEVEKTFKEAGTELNKLSLPSPMLRLGHDAIVDKTRLKITPAVLDIIIFEVTATGKAAFVNMTSGSINLSGPKVLHKEDSDGLEITEGHYAGGGGRPIPARSFRYPIRNNDGIVTGEVMLILSMAKIDEVQRNLLTAFALPAVIAVLVGLGIGFLMASSIVKPVKLLLRDIHAVSQGDLDHKTHAQSRDEIGLLAKAFGAMTVSLKAAHQAELETKALEHELNIATEIQSNLLPKRIPRFPGYDIGAFYRPSKEVGGDYYDFIQIDQENLGLVVADVSGKGIPGSMVMTMARSLLRMEAERNLSTADTLVKTNRILARDIRRGMFVTCMYIVLNVRNRTLLVSSAGHNPLIVARHATKKYELVNPNGIALGFDKGPIFERTIKEQRVQLFPGDRICAYTDGVVESMSLDMEEFGDERFYDMNLALAARTSNEFITTVVEALDKHQSTGPQHDDISLVTVRLLPT